MKNIQAVSNIFIFLLFSCNLSDPDSCYEDRERDLMEVLETVDTICDGLPVFSFCYQSKDSVQYDSLKVKIGDYNKDYSLRDSSSVIEDVYIGNCGDIAVDKFKPGLNTVRGFVFFYKKMPIAEYKMIHPNVEVSKEAVFVRVMDFKEIEKKFFILKN